MRRGPIHETQFSALQFLQAFETAVRAGASGGVATELNATRPAIKQQVRRLEEQLAAKLLLRGNWAMVLTPDCEALFQRIEARFDDIAQAVDAVSSEAGRTTLPLFVATFFSS